MRKTQLDKRTRLIETAMKLAYQRGFREASLADIAEAAHVPVGNVYYYFKTREELGEAVVERRLAQFREFLDQWDRLSSPKERLFAFVDNIRSNKDQLVLGGCPLAALSPRNPQRFTPSPWRGLRSSSGAPVMEKIHGNLRFMSSPSFRVWQRWRMALTTRMSWSRK